MTDTVDPEVRSKIMARVVSKGTKLERAVQAALIKRGWGSYEQHAKDVLGRPDFVYRKSKVAIFVDSCFWHGCPKHIRMPSSNVDYWAAKIARNKKRDVTVRSQLRREGWHVISIWEHELPDSRTLKGKLTRLKRCLGS